MTQTNLKLKITPLQQVLVGAVTLVVNEFLVDAQSRGLSTNTLRSYANELNAFASWLGKWGVVTMDEISSEVLRKYLLSLKARRNPGGQFAGYRVIRTLTYWWEKETDGDFKSPIRKVKPPKVNNQPLPGIQLGAITALLEACAGPNKLRDRALIYLLADTGIRATELCDLLIKDVDFAVGLAVIRHGKGNKRRDVYFGRNARKELRRYLERRSRLNPEAPLFATDEEDPLTYWGLRQIIRRLAWRAGIPEPGLHDFRRFFALSMLRNGADLISLARLMGHSGITVLQRYLYQVGGDLQALHAKASPVDRWQSTSFKEKFLENSKE